MKVTKITDGSLSTQELTFIKGKEVEVTKKVFDYIKKTFPKHFKFEEDVKPEPTVIKKDDKEEVKPTRGRKTQK